MRLRKLFICLLLVGAFLVVTVGASYAWFINGATITRITYNSNGIRLRLDTGTVYNNYLDSGADVDQMLAMALTAMSNGDTVNAEISGSGTIITLVQID